MQARKPHKVATEGRSRWYSSNELAGQGGVSSYLSNKLVGSVNVDKTKIPVVQPNGRLGDPAPTPPEGARHPHGLYFDAASRQIYQVLEHSGLAWNATRTGFQRATTADDESGLLVQIDASSPSRMRVVKGWVLGHAGEEVTMDTRDGKLLVGNHEPSPTITRADPDFASVINLKSRSHPYEFIDLPKGMDVQGVGYDRSLNTAYGVTHLGETIFAFDLRRRTPQIKYRVGLRAAFDAAEPGVLPGDWDLHMHDLTVAPATHQVYATVHTLGTASADVEADENADEEGTSTGPDPATEKRGEYVIALDASPRSRHFKKVSVIATPGVHAHFVAVDSRTRTLFVTGEHTGNLGVVGLRTGKLIQTVRITPPNPSDPQAEPEVHGVTVNPLTGTVYVADETSWHMAVSILNRT
ncbi:lactonase family protein [Streptomyces shenzhenensis]|uniref:hypothetical protein n=1 Tax=Streptomyces shenzhenensis TaxID=943815 RepID=UPI0015F0179C|nr:hypothetical protein [Streptomyces shenzhenensis]